METSANTQKIKLKPLCPAQDTPPQKIVLKFKPQCSTPDTNTKSALLENKPKYFTELGRLDLEFPIRPRSEILSQNQSDTEIGDATCWWVYDFIKSLDIISEISNLSSVVNHTYDLFVRLKNDPSQTIYGIQVKTMKMYINKNGTERYSMWDNKSNYDNNTLMIFISQDRKYYVASIFENISKTNVISDLSILKEYLIRLIPQSVIINNIYDGMTNINDHKSFNSIRTIKSTFEALGCKFEYENTVDSTTDIYINGHRCQCKLSSRIRFHIYEMCVHKTYKSKKIPYDRGDFEYLILLVVDNNNPHLYTNDICIIPESVLIDQNVIKTDTQKGKLGMPLCPPNHNEYHWTESFWNKPDIIFQNLTIATDPIYNFCQRFKCQIKNTKSKRGNVYISNIDHPFFRDMYQYLIIIINDGTKRLYSDYVYLMSHNDLIKENKTINNNKQVCMNIAPPDVIFSHWSLKYWVKIEDLDKI